MRHLTGIADLTDDEIVAILDAARGRDPKARQRTGTGPLAGRIVCAAFWEPSTRTRLSFEAAAHRLGADVVGFADAAVTSFAKGESLEDTIRVLSGYADCIVMRHPEEGSAARAAAAATVPVVNAGDGGGEHPTQTLVDLHTIREHFGDIAGRRVALVGDLRFGRTIHSLLPALRRMGAEVAAVPCPGLGLPQRLADDAPLRSLPDALAWADVVYATRVQRERFTDAEAHAGAEDAVRITPGALDEAGFEGIVLHPLPRLGELPIGLDAHPAAKYFEQARNGVAVRMAVLTFLLEDLT